MDQQKFPGFFIYTCQSGQEITLELNGFGLAKNVFPEKNGCFFTEKNGYFLIYHGDHYLFSSDNNEKGIDALWEYLLKNILAPANTNKLAKGENVPISIPKELLTNIDYL